jgi:hypothetical protein
VGPRAGLDRCGKSRPTGIRSPERPACSQSLYRLRYPSHETDAMRLRNLQLQNTVTGRDRFHFISLLTEILCSISDILWNVSLDFLLCMADLFLFVLTWKGVSPCGEPIVIQQ